MTNKEILQADLLDILFEHRNKFYGAYALRKTYNDRLRVALGIALSTIMLFVFLSFINNKRNTRDPHKPDPNAMKLTQIDLSRPDDPTPPKPRPEIKPKATVDYQQFKIVEDDKADDDIVDIADIKNANIGDQNIDGDKPDGLITTIAQSNDAGKVEEKKPDKPDEPALPTRNASFPGGTAAWLDFLRRFLQSPEALEPGQRIAVQVRFWVDIDGSVSKAEIIKSGGKSFDKEVLRVLKKMPAWEPAIQNGNYVAVAYTQPVIFIGVED
ncbi:MAG TPA: energy transducer TonB [Chitinophagaceae bacterium]|nr:energy transducer TonB [Chitinophagaceae bacterium]